MKLALRVAFALWVLLAGAGAQAAITCTTITSPGWSAGYQNRTTTGGQTSWTITCSRGSTSDPTTLDYSVTVNNGIHNTGINNFAALGGRRLAYDLYTTGCGGAQWKNKSLSGTVTWPSTTAVGVNATDTQYFWACINTSQTAGSSGDYQDTITMTATYSTGSGNATVKGTIPINIYTPAFCFILPAPGNVSITYPAFSAIDQVATTTFGAMCTSGMPYTLDVSPAGGTIAGVNYNVTLNTNSGVGAGFASQTYTITVTAPAGQGGTCAGATCMASQTHTLTLTY